MTKEKKLEFTKENFESIIEENKQLKHEVASLHKIVNSRRYQFADKVGNLYNRIAPEHTVRRKIARGIYAPVRAYKKSREQSLEKKIEKLSSKYDRIIVMHSIPWNTPLKQRPHHLASRLAEHNLFMIYLEPDEALTKFRRVGNNFITTNSFETVLNLKKNVNSEYFFFFNNVLDIPLETVKKIKDSGYKIIYEYIDEFHEDISGSMTNQLEVWNNIKKIAPVAILASADKLFDDAVRKYKKDGVLLSKNAVNITDFDFHNYKDVEVPSDLKKIVSTGHKIVGYYGAISPWLNYDLIHKTAKDNPDIEFVFIGVNYQNCLKNLNQSIRNIHFLGPKDYKILPHYSTFFDCAIIPFNYGEIAKGTSPVKLFEYMAMGIPTVGTRDLKECYGYNHVFIAKDDNDFSAMIKKAVKEKEDESIQDELLEQAKQNSWRKRSDDIIDFLDSLNNK